MRPSASPFVLRGGCLAPPLHSSLPTGGGQLAALIHLPALPATECQPASTSQHPSMADNSLLTPANSTPLPALPSLLSPTDLFAARQLSTSTLCSRRAVPLWPGSRGTTSCWTCRLADRWVLMIIWAGRWGCTHVRRRGRWVVWGVRSVGGFVLGPARQPACVPAVP